jgi:phage repressor protein C with HTH and peptisase S24 domain
VKTISDRIKIRRTELQLSQRDLADKIGVTSVAVSRWELDYSQPKGKNLLSLSKALKCTPNWLLNGRESTDIEFEGIKYVLVPYYENVEIAAGCGSFNIEHLECEQIPIPFYILDKSKVNSNKTLCVKVKGDSMEPALRSGSIIAVDTTKREIDDGELYVVCHGDLLRVKLLYRYPHGIKLRSYNSFYEDEMYENESVMDIKIIGKVFWASVFFK